MIATWRGVRAWPVVALAIASCGLGVGQIGAASAVPPSHPSAATSHPLVASARWTHPVEGYRLHVTPTHAGRDRAKNHASRALSEAIQSAGTVPFTMTASIHDSLLNQLKCHAVFAPTKPHWNLEAWRPDVGYTATVEAFCNP